MNATRNNRRTIEGLVTSNRMEKTITVEVVRTFRHAKYKKFLRKKKKYHAHDENNEARAGDRVELAACRPLSKLKRWRLVRILERGVLTADLGTDEALEGALGVKKADASAAAPAKTAGSGRKGGGA